MLDYVDRIEEAQAGSPVRDKKYYPLGDLYLVDNVCRRPSVSIRMVTSLNCAPMSRRLSQGRRRAGASLRLASNGTTGTGQVAAVNL